MNMKYTTLLIVLLAITLTGCGEEATYQGQPTSYWLDMVDDADWDTSYEAQKVLEELYYEDNKAKSWYDKQWYEDLDRLKEYIEEYKSGNKEDFESMTRLYYIMTDSIVPNSKEAILYGEKILEIYQEDFEAEVKKAEEKAIEEHKSLYGEKNYPQFGFEGEYYSTYTLDLESHLAHIHSVIENLNDLKTRGY